MALAGLYGAAGAAQGLERLLARRMLERQQAERERAQLAEEALKRRDIEETSGLRRATLEQTSADREAARAQQLAISKMLEAGRMDRADTSNERLSNQFRESQEAMQNRFETGQQNMLSRLITLQDYINNRQRDRFSIQPYQLPDKRTILVRVNNDTGEATPINLDATIESAQPVTRPKAEKPNPVLEFLGSLKQRWLPGRSPSAAPQTPGKRRYVVTPVDNAPIPSH